MFKYQRNEEYNVFNHVSREKRQKDDTANSHKEYIKNRDKRKDKYFEIVDVGVK